MLIFLRELRGLVRPAERDRQVRARLQGLAVQRARLVAPLANRAHHTGDERDGPTQRIHVCYMAVASNRSPHAYHRFTTRAPAARIADAGSCGVTREIILPSKSRSFLVLPRRGGAPGTSTKRRARISSDADCAIISSGKSIRSGASPAFGVTSISVRAIAPSPPSAPRLTTSLSILPALLEIAPVAGSSKASARNKLPFPRACAATEVLADAASATGGASVSALTGSCVSTPTGCAPSATAPLLVAAGRMFADATAALGGSRRTSMSLPITIPSPKLAATTIANAAATPARRFLVPGTSTADRATPACATAGSLARDGNLAKCAGMGTSVRSPPPTEGVRTNAGPPWVAGCVAP